MWESKATMTRPAELCFVYLQRERGEVPHRAISALLLVRHHVRNLSIFSMTCERHFCLFPSVCLVGMVLRPCSGMRENWMSGPSGRPRLHALQKRHMV